MSFRCIKLDASWKPVGIISWFDAFSQIYLPPYPCMMLHEYPEKYKIRAAFESWTYPSIIALKTFIRPKRAKKDIKPSLKSILTRDMYQCQYCGDRLTNKTGTRDHVIPESKGGPTSWTNLVACCKSCQDKKKDHMPKEVNMFPEHAPTAPEVEESFSKLIKLASSFERKCWTEGMEKLDLKFV